MLPLITLSQVASRRTPKEGASGARFTLPPMFELEKLLPVTAIRPASGPIRSPNLSSSVKVLADTAQPQASRRSTPPPALWASTLALIVIP